MKGSGADTSSREPQTEEELEILISAVHETIHKNTDE